MSEQRKCQNTVAWCALVVAIVSAIFAGLRLKQANTIHEQSLFETQYQAYMLDGTVTLHQTGGATYPLSQIRVSAWFQKDSLDTPSKGQGFPLAVSPPRLINHNKPVDRTFIIRNIDSIICEKEPLDCSEYKIVAIDFLFKVHGEERTIKVQY